MNSVAPQIGFDRFIQLDWARAALRVRAGVASMEELLDLIDRSHAGAAAKKKTRTVLNRLWLDPRSSLADFADRGVRIYRKFPGTSVSTLSWGMAITTYPFFGRVAEIVGRLTALQGDCASSEVHRRMTEIYGEREGTRRMTNMVLQSQSSWGAIDRGAGGRRLTRRQKTAVEEPHLVAWLVEACVRYSGRPLAVATLASSPVLYPFELNGSVPFAISDSPNLEVSHSGSHEQVVTVMATQIHEEPVL
jgi:hypothetical protein